MWCPLFLICWDPAVKCSLMVVGPWRNQGLALRGENQSAALHATDTYQNLSIKESSVCLSLWSMHDHWISYHCWYWFWSQFTRSQFAWSLDFLPLLILILISVCMITGFPTIYDTDKEDVRLYNISFKYRHQKKGAIVDQKTVRRGEF